MTGYKHILSALTPFVKEAQKVHRVGFLVDEQISLLFTTSACNTTTDFNGLDLVIHYEYRYMQAYQTSKEVIPNCIFIY